MSELIQPMTTTSQAPVELLEQHEATFKALADKRRLRILFELCQRGQACVCDLVEVMGMPQSSLSYHLKMLVDANLLRRETRGTWSFYEINDEAVSAVLSEQLCCIFRPSHTVARRGCC